MTINVTRKHIKQGERRATDCCPVALALKEQVKGIRDIYVSRDYITYYLPNTYSTWSLTPRSVQRFIKKFDTGKPVAPFNFKLKR